MFLIIEKSEETIFESKQNFASIIWFWLCIKMRSQKIIRPCYSESSKFVTKKWYVINNQNNTDYGEGNENGATVKFKTKVIKSNLCDYSDLYIFVIGDMWQQVAMLILELRWKIVLHLQNA